MEELFNKIQELNSLLKAIKVSSAPKLPEIPAIQAPPQPSMKAKATTTKIPGVNPNSKKDPKKIEQQLKNAQVKKQTMPLLKFQKNGQWSLS